MIVDEFPGVELFPLSSRWRRFAGGELEGGLESAMTGQTDRQ